MPKQDKMVSIIVIIIIIIVLSKRQNNWMVFVLIPKEKDLLPRLEYLQCPH